MPSFIDHANEAGFAAVLSSLRTSLECIAGSATAKRSEARTAGLTLVAILGMTNHDQ
jgi:hypothetical protein